MSHSHHSETHRHSLPALRDFVLGMSDGLTVPFALTAGLAGVLNSNAIVVTAGLAEIVAGAISMGVGGFLAAGAESDHYESEYRRELHEIEHMPQEEEREVAEILRQYSLDEEHVQMVVAKIKEDPARWADFMMLFELGLEKPDPSRRYASPLIIGGAYAIGGLIPLVPYFFLPTATEALAASTVLTAAALLAFGAFKGWVTGVDKFRSAWQTTLTVALAAATAYLIARGWNPR